MSGGIHSVFLHASEAIHGDLGIYKPGDVTIVLSKSGSTSELIRLMPVFKAFQSPVIAILGRVDSPIANASDIVLDASVEKEADPLNLMPTSSAAVALAIGDALASALVTEKGFTSEEFARYHPGGQLGRNLLLSVGMLCTLSTKWLAFIQQTPCVMRFLPCLNIRWGCMCFRCRAKFNWDYHRWGYSSVAFK